MYMINIVLFFSYGLIMARLPYDILYQNLLTMYIGNLCNSCRFHSMGFFDTPFIKII